MVVISDFAWVQGRDPAKVGRELAQRGIDLSVRRDQGLLNDTPLADVMRREVVTVDLDTDLEHLKALFLHRHLPIFVTDEKGRLFGSIEFDDLADAAFDPEEQRQLTARDLVHRTPVAVDGSLARRGCSSADPVVRRSLPDCRSPRRSVPTT